MIDKSQILNFKPEPQPIGDMKMIVPTASPTIGNTTVVCSVVGIAFEEDHWQVTCPNCQKEFEYKGYFDSSDTTKCKCGTSFKTSRIEFENGSYIE